MENNGFLLFDGAMGTELQKRGLKPGGLPELLNLTDGAAVRAVHEAYVKAGADIITANTFGANRHKLAEAASVRDVVFAAVKLAKEAGAKYTALDMGPTGAMLRPLGDMSFDEIYDIFAETAIVGREAGADLVVIETMSDLLEAKAALLAVKENTDLPAYVTMTFASDGRTFLGTSPREAAITLSSLGADAVGINCSLGPKELLPIVEEMLRWSSVPVLVQPNAGLPRIVDGEARYDVGAEEFASLVGGMLDMGVNIAGGCCGTTPEHIAALRREMQRRTPVKREISRVTSFTSSGRTVILNGKNTAVIGERINPTGKKKLKEALRTENYDYILNEAISQSEAGAQILDVNAGLPEIDEPAVLEKLVTEIQAVSRLPLQIDSSDPEAVERAVRVYAGKPIINSVNGKEESLRDILPIVKKYGTAVVALTLDENGIPDRAEDRLRIAEKIVKRAESMGIPREDVLVDCLVMTASANQKIVMETVKAVRLVKEKLGVKTVLGVSNVSFGLPDRETVNSVYLAAALGAGLDMPILNPLSRKYMDVISAYRVLSGEDDGAKNYIASHSSQETVTEPVSGDAAETDITQMILSGRKLLIEDAVREKLKNESPMEVINGRLIPAINEAGERFEKGEFFLPQLMASAETVKLAFEVVKNASDPGAVTPKGQVLLATVKGDIHDIGKNIVKMLLGNYGYDVVDMGRDVKPEDIVKETIGRNIKLVGLSALMTTTVKSMEETIKALRDAGAECKIMVGGAVLTEEYAEMVGADFYACDAAESARIAEKILGGAE